MKWREFERCVASLTPWTETAVDVVGRALRGADLIPHGPRGPGAPEIEPKHAALALVALASNCAPSAVVGVVESYGGMTERDQAFKSVPFAESLELILSDPAESCGVTEVRVCHDEPLAWIATEDGRVIRFGTDRRRAPPAHSIVVRETRMSVAFLSQLAVELADEELPNDGWLAGDGATKSKLEELAARERAALAPKADKKGRKR